MFFDIKGDFAGIGPDCGIIRPPPRRHSFGKGTTSGIALGVRKRSAPNQQITIWEMPRDHDRVGSRLTWGERPRKQNRSAIPPPTVEFVGSVVRSECPR